MARVQNPLIGKASGSVGGATFSTWKGINVLKSKPETVANPNTIGQQKQRNKMRVAVDIYRLIAVVIAFGFKQQAVAKSAYNAFVSEALNNAITTAPDGTASIDFPNLLVSKGTMGTTVASQSRAGDGGNSIELQWDANALPPGASANDVAMLVVMTENGETVFASAAIATRDAGAAIVNTNIEFADGEVYHSYLSFYSPSNGTSSDSSYSQVEIIA